ncbi:hypothetical protein F0562_004398 [Nyssa sinensis]|uniref:Uncharacterized protein n=1 Tax=Nyssa sinensis TaxID=561372 RepID=A0A5J5BYH4_9ASTE|nr:hypothetical protein F0562_004398 [Nyssa sinensis]
MEGIISCKAKAIGVAAFIISFIVLTTRSVVHTSGGLPLKAYLGRPTSEGLPREAYLWRPTSEGLALPSLLAMLALEAWLCHLWRYISATSGGMSLPPLEAQALTSSGCSVHVSSP